MTGRTAISGGSVAASSKAFESRLYSRILRQYPPPHKRQKRAKADIWVYDGA